VSERQLDDLHVASTWVDPVTENTD
jgi:aspartyl-tRNA synthetase